MFITVHAAVGAFLGKKIASAPLAFLAGFVSHFLLDIIPHGDQKIGNKLTSYIIGREKQQQQKFRELAIYGMIDAFFVLMYVIFLFNTYDFENKTSVSWAIIGALLPDIIAGLYIVGKIKGTRWFYKIHDAIHWSVLNKLPQDMNLKTGILMQILILIFFVWLIYQI